MNLTSDPYYAHFGFEAIPPTGSMIVPFCGSYVGSYKVTPKRNYNGAYE